MKRWQIAATIIAVPITAFFIVAFTTDAGTVHPGQKALINTSGATGCDTDEAFTKLKIYVTQDHDIKRANRELMYTQRCSKLSNQEKVNVLKESGDLRKVQRSDGTEVWTHWMFLSLDY